MSKRRRESLLKLAAIAEKRGESSSLPQLSYVSTRIRMPHEKETEIGERLIRKKMTTCK